MSAVAHNAENARTPVSFSKARSRNRSPLAPLSANKFTGNASVKTSAKTLTPANQFAKTPVRSAGPKTIKAAGPTSHCKSAQRHICKLCGVGPLASEAQLREHQQGKKHLQRASKLQRANKWTPSKAARQRAQKQARRAWKVSPARAAPQQAEHPKAEPREEAEASMPTVHFEADLLMTIDAPTLALGSEQAEEVVPSVASSDEPAVEVKVATCHAIVARTGKPCTLKAKANGRCGRHKAEKFAQ